MDKSTIGFIGWTVVGCLLIGIGITAFFKKEAMGFWANIKIEAVKDIKNYNDSVGKLFILYGIVFILLGTPLLMGQNSPFILLSIIGVMIETIIAMAIYNIVIEGKYRK